MTDFNTTPAAVAADTIVLSTEPIVAPQVELTDPNVSAQTIAKVEDTPLTDAEKKAVNDFVQKIDLNNTNLVLQYGAAAQSKIANFSEAALGNVRTKDFGEVGGMITDLVVELKGFDVDAVNKKGFLGLFKSAGNRIVALKAKYDKADVNVEKIAQVLENHQIRLMKDIATLDEMYNLNLTYFKELTMYILAGKKKLESVKANELQQLRAKAKQSGTPEDAQAAKDYEQMINRFEKKLYDLELTRNISIQMAPQVRLIQNNDTVMTEKIQTTLVNTIPLWKSQMVIALGLAHAQQALEAQKAVTDMTNELLLKNSENLKTGSIAVAQESERGIVDVETLQQTNRNLIETLDEVLRIQAEGREKRAAAEVELGRIEGELKAKLLEIRDNGNN